MKIIITTATLFILSIFTAIAQEYYSVDKDNTIISRNGDTINWKAGYIIEVKDSVIYWGNDTIDYKQKRTTETKVDTSFVLKKDSVSFIFDHLDSLWIVHNKLGKTNLLFDKRKDTLLNEYNRVSADDSLIQLFYDDSVTLVTTSRIRKNASATVPLFFHVRSLPIESEIKRGDDSLAVKKYNRDDITYLYQDSILDYCYNNSLLSKFILDTTLLYFKSGNNYLVFDKKNIISKKDELIDWMKNNLLLIIPSFVILLIALVFALVAFFRKKQKSAISVENSVHYEYLGKDDEYAVFKVISKPDQIKNLCNDLKIDEGKIKNKEHAEIEVFIALELKKLENKSMFNDFINNRCSGDIFCKINGLRKIKELEEGRNYYFPQEGQLTILEEYSKKCAGIMRDEEKESFTQSPLEKLNTIIEYITNWINKESAEEINIQQKESLNKNLYFLQEKIYDLREIVAKEIEDSKQKNEASEKIQEKYKKEIEEKNGEIEKLKEEINKIVKEKEESLEKEKKDRKTEVDNLTKQKEEEIQKIQGKYQTEIQKKENIIDFLKKERDTIVQEKDEHYKSIIKEKEKSLVKEKSDRQAEVDNLIKQKKAEMQKIQDDHQIELQKKDNWIIFMKKECDTIVQQKDIHYKNIIKEKEDSLIKERNKGIEELERLTQQKNKEISNEKQAGINAVNAEKEKSKRYHDNVIFADELKPYAEKTLDLMDKANILLRECNKLYNQEKEKEENNRILIKAFAKFQSTTYTLDIGNWREQLNNIVNNGTLIIPLKGKENRYSSCYAAIRHIVTDETDKRAEEFQKAISIALLNRYSNALLVLIEDMILLGEHGVSLPEQIKNLRYAIRIHLKKELELEMNDILLLASSRNNSGIRVIDKIPTRLNIPENSVIEVLSYGIERRGTSIPPTQVITSK